MSFLHNYYSASGSCGKMPEQWKAPDLCLSFKWHQTQSFQRKLGRRHNPVFRKWEVNTTIIWKKVQELDQMSLEHWLLFFRREQKYYKLTSQKGTACKTILYLCRTVNVQLDTPLTCLPSFPHFINV